MPVSRRDFLTKLGAFTGAALPGMMALDMLRAAPVHPIPQGSNGKGKTVLILGAGLAGMAAAYELSKLGYQCTILEARERTGGRAFSPRKGAVSEEITNGKITAGFDDGLYFNAGPSRIPHHHAITLHYCKELGVPLEVYNNTNESAYFFAEGKGKLSNQKIRKREIHNDIRGYMAELLAKAVHTNALDAAMTKEDGERFLEYIRAEGGLNIDDLYKGSARRGYMEPPGAGEKVGKIAEPHKLADIIGSGLLGTDFYAVAEYVYELQATMLQAVGGNDNIAKAFEKKLAKGMVKLNAVVSDISNKEKEVVVTYTDPLGTHTITADYCICTIPLPVLSNINHNFSSDVSRAIDRTVYNMTNKIGLQFERRFWEEDEMIFGGITHTNNELYQIFYPSNDYLQKKGILLGYYNFNEEARAISEMSFAGREKFALDKGRLIHPQYDTDYGHKSFSISWHKTKYSLGGWAIYSEEERESHYKALLRAEKQVYFAGEHVTYLNGWMAGALESARATVAQIQERNNL